MPYRLYLCLAYSIPSPPMLMQHMHQQFTKWYDPLYIITWPCWFINLDLTCSSLLSRSIGTKSTTCPSLLQPVYQAKSCLDLLHLSDMTLICNEILHHMYEPCNKSKPSSPSWHELLTQVYLWIDHLCISQLNTLVHLGCHSIIKTKLGTFQLGTHWN